MSASLVVFFLCLIASFKSQVLMVELPNKLVFYDEFEQKIDKPTFASYTPFTILKRNTTLSDKLTNCIYVRFNKSRYFILKNEKKSLVNYKEAGIVQVFQNQNIKVENVSLSNEVNYYSNINLKKATGKIPSGSYASYLEREKLHLLQYGDHKFVWVESKKLNVQQKSSILKNHKSDTHGILIEILSQSNELYKKYQSLYKISISPVWEKKGKQYLLISNDIKFKETLFNEFLQHIEKKGLSEYVEFDKNLFSVRVL